MNQAAIQTAQELQQLASKSARWIAADALRELTSEKVQQKLSVTIQLSGDRQLNQAKEA